MTTMTSMHTRAMFVILLAAVLGTRAQVETLLETTGGKLKGTVENGVQRFVGIPFAKPPVDDLRFKPPAKAAPWSEVRMASELPNSCWQIYDTNFGRFPGVEMWNPNTPLSEDCLYLNVWIPNNSDKQRPILVWIYGGGFWAGTSTLDVYEPSKLVAMKDVIVVSMNYRIGPFGFLYSGQSDAPGNVGLLDQVMAMQWVKDNAANMGGDPNKITIIGESAGAASVGYHLLSPLSKNLFTYGIMMSSSPFADWGIKSHKESFNRFEKLAKLLGCKSGKTSDVTKCLRGVDASKLAAEQWSVVDGTYFDPPFALVTGDQFLPQSPEEIMKAKQAKQTNVIAGVVQNEGIFWLLYGFPDVFKLKDPNPVSDAQLLDVMNGILAQQKQSKESVKDFTKLIYSDSVPPVDRPSNLNILDAISGDTLFKCSVRRFASQFSAMANSRAYEYSFNYRLSPNPWPKYLGVPHGYEIEAFFGLPFLHHENYTDVDRIVSQDTMDYITNFADTGNPNSGPHTMKVQWPALTMLTEKYLAIDQISSAQAGLRFEECKYWDKGVPVLDKQKGAASGVPSSKLPAVGLLVILCAILILSGSVLPC